MTTESIPLRQRTLPQLLERQARLFGSKPLLTIPGAQWTHRDAATRAAARASALRAAGQRSSHNCRDSVARQSHG